LISFTLHNIGKRFNTEWIFRKINLEIHAGESYAIIGNNGSGKSTLLQVIAGAILQSEGSIEAKLQNGKVTTENLFSHISFCAPYLELIEELTADEMLEFHSKFKPLILPNTEILKIVNLNTATNKQIRFFSSGMKQRLKLAQAFFSNTPGIMLDEPTTNLDADGIALYHKLVTQYLANKTIIVSSNDEVEYNFCNAKINMADYK
jgi:ABC-type multidrug transport system ATPase subunit